MNSTDLQERPSNNGTETVTNKSSAMKKKKMMDPKKKRFEN